jgi:hypothetical protein
MPVEIHNGLVWVAADSLDAASQRRGAAMTEDWSWETASVSVLFTDGIILPSLSPSVVAQPTDRDDGRYPQK